MKKTFWMRILSVTILLLITSLACTLEAAPEPTLDPAINTALAVPTDTIIPQPSATSEPTPTAPPLPTATSGGLPGFSVWVNVASLNLRAGPGTMFEVVGQELQGTQCEALGRAPGDDWLRVQVPDGTVGYMLTTFLELSGPLSGLSQVSINESYIVMGRAWLIPKVEPVNDINVEGISGDWCGRTTHGCYHERQRNLCGVPSSGQPIYLDCIGGWGGLHQPHCG